MESAFGGLLATEGLSYLRFSAELFILPSDIQEGFHGSYRCAEGASREIR